MSQATSTLVYPMARQQKRATRCALLLALALGSVLTHAALSRAHRGQENHPEVRVLPSASLVLSTRSRWLRHPLLSEPGSAFHDGPAFFDADPAGALHSAPRALFRAEALAAEAP